MTVLSGPNSHMWKADNNINYRSAHFRIAKAKGKASAYPCVDCGQQAQHWSYNHQDSNEKVGINNGCKSIYSTDPAYYDPRCARCHWALDQKPQLQIALVVQ